MHNQNGNSLSPTRMIALILVALNLVAAHRPALASSKKAPLLFPGFLRSHKTQFVVADAQEDWRFKISNLVPDNTKVAKGDILLKLTGENIDNWENQSLNSLEQGRVTLERDVLSLQNEVATLQDSVAQQEREILLFQLEKGTSGSLSTREDIAERLRAIDALDAEQRKTKLQLSKEKLARKEDLLRIKQKMIERNKNDASRLLSRMKSARESGIKHAQMDGVVIHRRGGWEKNKPKEGATVYSGSDLLAVVDERDLYVEGYLREDNWKRLSPDCRVEVKIMGQSNVSVSGKVSQIGSMVLPVSRWDQTIPDNSPLKEMRAFKVLVALDSVPESAKPEGEVSVTARDCAREKQP